MTTKGQGWGFRLNWIKGFISDYQWFISKLSVININLYELLLTCRGHPGNHLHMRASVSGFAGFPSEIFTCSRSSNPRFGGSMKQHMNLHLRVPKHIHRPLDLHNYLITILPIPWNPEIWFFIRQGADTRVFANSCGSLKACGQKRTKCNPIKKENIQPFFPQCLKAFGH